MTLLRYSKNLQVTQPSIPFQFGFNPQGDSGASGTPKTLAVLGRSMFYLQVNQASIRLKTSR